MTDFPSTLAGKQDSAKFGFEQENVGIRSEMEGGYVLTRPRHTRTPRRTWKTGFTNLSDAEKTTLETFINQQGTYKAFNYTLPVSGTIVNVRFKDMPKFEYHGMGTNLRWDVNDIMLEEV
jgi:phage-related protein